MKVLIDHFSKEIVFPIVQAQPSKKQKGFISIIKRWLIFKRLYKIMEDYIIWSEYLQSFIFIPKGFLEDNASVPKVLNSFFKSDGMLLYGAVPHDFGYRFQGLILIDEEGFLFFKRFNQQELDIIFEKLCAEESGMPKSAKLAKIILYQAGKKTYSYWKNQELKIENVFPGLL